MKLKNATLLAIIGVVIQLIPLLMHFLASINILEYWKQETHQVNWYMQYLGILNFIGTALLLPFFITLFKSQK